MKLFHKVTILFLLVFFPVTAHAGKVFGPPGFTDSKLRLFLQDNVDTYGNTSTVYFGDGSQLSSINLTDTDDAILKMEEGFVPPPDFFNSVSHQNNGYAGQHVRIGDTIYIHERYSANNMSSKKFAGYNIKTKKYTQLDSSPVGFCDKGSYAVAPNDTKILWIRGNCGASKSDITYIYKTDTDLWDTTVADFPASVITASSDDFGMTGQMPTYGDTSYYFGGFEPSGNGDYAFAYNWSNDTFIRIADLPDTWDLASASPAYENQSGTAYIYLSAGEINGNGNPSQEFWKYNIDKNSYTQLKEIPTDAKSEGGAFFPYIFDNKLLFLSSRTEVSGSDGLALYDIENNYWSDVYSDATAGFVGLGSKQVSVSNLDVIKHEDSYFIYMLANPTTHADEIGYKMIPLKLNVPNK